MHTFAFAVGVQVRHEKRGLGVVRELTDDGKTRVEFENGETHAYKSTSMHKFSAERTSRSLHGAGTASKALHREGATRQLIANMKHANAHGGIATKCAAPS